MSTADIDAEASRRTATAPYSARHPVPTISRYQEQQQHRDEQTLPAEDASDEEEEPSILRRAGQKTKALFGHHHGPEAEHEQSSPYESANQNHARPSETDDDKFSPQDSNQDAQPRIQGHYDDGEGESTRHAQTEPNTDGSKQDDGNPFHSIVDGLLGPKAEGKQPHHSKKDHREREVLDPVTHLSVTIHDADTGDIQGVPENMPAPSPSEGHGEADGTADEKHPDTGTSSDAGVQKLFPPPQFDIARAELVRIFQFTISIGLGLILAGVLTVMVVTRLFDMGLSSWNGKQDREPQEFPGLGLMISTAVLATVVAGSGGFIIWALRGWLENKINDIWQNEVWEAERDQGKASEKDSVPESTHWLNSILSSIWPLVNPDLFTSLADQLEDVMQASLPKLVKMISVEDLGQGSEAIRILGVRWLPTGAAASSVSDEGKIQSSSTSERKGSRVSGEVERKNKDTDNHQAHESSSPGAEDDSDDSAHGDQGIAEGMEAEEGDFVNVEVAIAYRARASGRSLRTKAKNAHLYLAFYLVGGIRFPVWVELRGMVASLRMRLQLTPDPPFFALCTLTFLGQPKVDLSCVPLSKKGLNVMDLPLISGFVQSSVDAAMAEYVAPKSLTLDIKDMIVGDDFKKDTATWGVLVVRIKRADDFKRADGGASGLLKGSSDPYVSVGWAKFGKTLWSTRVITEEMHPIWDETNFIPVGPNEANAEERLTVTLWDSDRMTADDELGRVEVGLKDLMKDNATKGKMCDRRDNLQGIKKGEQMPGKIEWSVGYFSKIGILPGQLKAQTVDTSIKDLEALKQKTSASADKKLREAISKDESQEVGQQRSQELHSTATQMIASAPPSDEYVSGMLSITIHQIEGLEMVKLNKHGGDEDEGNEADEDEREADDMPSSYCHVILNHTKVFRTRTKPKTAQPFFNAGTEKFVRDWRSTELMVSVRDARSRENDPIIGIVVLHLPNVFKHRSQVNDYYPLIGGVGHGRIRISLMFRSVQLRLPKELLGWDWGTLQITSDIRSKDLAPEYTSLRLKLHTTLSKGKMRSTEGGWKGKHDRPVHLAVRKRYRSCVVIEFRRNRIGPDKTPAFAVIWLKDIPDEEERTITAPVWRCDGNLKRAETCCETDLGEKVGHIEVPLKFWSGLSGYHKALSAKVDDVRDVVEVLDCAHEDKEARDDAEGDDSDSDSSNSDGEPRPPEASSSDGTGPTIKSGDAPKQDDHRGPIDQMKDYVTHKDELHRRHRGLMQWKTPRTMKWVKTKLAHSGGHLTDHFNNKEREPGIETEA